MSILVPPLYPPAPIQLKGLGSVPVFIHKKMIAHKDRRQTHTQQQYLISRAPTRNTHDNYNVFVLQGAYRSWKVVKFKIQIFQAWKVMELGLGPGKSRKINQMVAAFLIHVRFRPFHRLSLSAMRLCSICCLV